jgi:hypothetical protein
MATLEERIDHFGRYYWPTLSRRLPLEFVHSECILRSTFKRLFGVEETEEERLEYMREASRICSRLQ